MTQTPNYILKSKFNWLSIPKGFVLSHCSITPLPEDNLESYDDINIRYLFKEKQVRTQMTNFYQSLEAYDNAREILKYEFNGDFTAYGNPITRDCFTNFIYWLQDLKGLALNDEVYSQQILEPVKLTSDYILKIAERTTKISGWVFAKSKKYKDSYGDYKNTITMIVPELCTVMSLRCHEKEADKISYGMHEFSHIKPIPLANRLLQFKSKCKKIKELIPFGDWDFLKTSLEDIDHFKCSIEMEHYCEVPFKDSEKRHLLGAPLIVAGKVEAVNWPYISISSPTNPDFEIEFSISKHLEKNIEPIRIDDFEGKYVKLLCVCLYDSGLEPKSHPKHPEAFFITECKDKQEAAIHEMVGFVRTHSSTSISELNSRFTDIDVSKIDNLQIKNGTVSIKSSQKSGNDVSDHFHEVVEKIASLRNNVEKKDQLFLEPEDVLDRKKVSIKILSKRQDDVDILLQLIRLQDFEGISGFQHLPIDDKKKRSSKKKWFYNAGLIEKSGDYNFISRKGIAVAYRSQKNLIKFFIQSMNEKIFSIIKFEKNFHPSLLQRYFEESGYKKFKINGSETGLFWHDSQEFPTKEDEKLVGDELNTLCEPAMKKIANVRHQLHVDLIIEELMIGNSGWRKMNEKRFSLSFFCATRLLDYIETQGLITKENNFFGMSLYSRIYILLKSNPEKIFSSQELAKKIIFPGEENTHELWGKTDDMKIELIRKELESLIKNKKVILFKKDFWQCYLNPEQFKNKLEKFLRSKIKISIIEILENKKIDEQEFTDWINYRARKICEDVSQRMDSKILQQEIIAEMIEKNEIIFANGMVELSGSINDKQISKELII